MCFAAFDGLQTAFRGLFVLDYRAFLFNKLSLGFDYVFLKKILGLFIRYDKIFWWFLRFWLILFVLVGMRNVSLELNIPFYLIDSKYNRPNNSHDTLELWYSKLSIAIIITYYRNCLFSALGACSCGLEAGDFRFKK
jgi:hypothetical protein